MKLTCSWQKVLKRAWSIRLMILAALLSGVEVALPFFATAVPAGMFAALSFLAVASAFIARLAAQKDMENA